MGLSLVAIREIAFTGGVLVFGSGGDEVSFFDVVNAKTVSYL